MLKECIIAVLITDNQEFCRWCFDVELVYLCKWFGIPMHEISVNWSEIPGSKVNPLSIPNMLWELVLMSVGYRTGMWKIRTWVASLTLISMFSNIMRLCGWPPLDFSPRNQHEYKWTKGCSGTKIDLLEYKSLLELTNQVFLSIPSFDNVLCSRKFIVLWLPWELNF